VIIGLGHADFGYTCSGCGEFVPYNEGHTCGGQWIEDTSGLYPFAFGSDSDFVLSLTLDEMNKKLNQILDEIKEIREELA